MVIININEPILLINEFLIKNGYNIDQIYIDNLWDSIKDKKWLYIDEKKINWIGFNYERERRNKEKYINLINNNFIENLHYKYLNSSEFKEFYVHYMVHIESNINEHNKVKHLLVSPRCFKESLMLLGTEKAKLIRRYYLDLEEIFQLYIEYQNEYQKQLLKSKEVEIKDIHYNNKVNRHKELIEKNKNKQCLYLLEFDENHIKIGTTKAIDKRLIQLKSYYKSNDLIYLDVFDTPDYEQIETNIKNNIDIKRNLIKEYNGVTTTEIVKLTDRFNYDQLITIVKKNISDELVLSQSRKLELKKLEDREKEREFEIEKLKLLVELQKTNSTLDINNIFEFNKIYDAINELKEEVSLLKNNNHIEESDNEEEIEQEIIGSTEQYNGRKVPKGRRIQKIDPNNLTCVLEVFDGMVALLRSTHGYLYNKRSIQDAIKKNTIFANYRWNFVNHGEDPFISKVLPTVALKRASVLVEPIIKLDETKTKIIKVYKTKSECEKDNNISSFKLKNSLENNKMIESSYYILSSACDKDLLIRYNINLDDYKHIPHNAKKIIKINPLTKEEEIFNTMDEINRKLGVNGKNINEAIKNNSLCMGYYWKLA